MDGIFTLDGLQQKLSVAGLIDKNGNGVLPEDIC
jgi:hypothetical protein